MELRSHDLDVLADYLDLDDAALVQQFVRVALVTHDEALELHRQLLRRPILASVAGLLAGGLATFGLAGHAVADRPVAAAIAAVVTTATPTHPVIATTTTTSWPAPVTTAATATTSTTIAVEPPLRPPQRRRRRPRLPRNRRARPGPIRPGIRRRPPPPRMPR